jgi:AcrR family transcriptional regulator
MFTFKGRGSWRTAEGANERFPSDSEQPPGFVQGGLMERGAGDRRSRRSRRLIAQALIDLMQERRYDRITVQEIIDRADVGRSTFYGHFRDKEDVLTSETERVVRLLYEHAEADTSGGQPLLPSLELFRHVSDQHALYRAMVRGRVLDVFYDATRRSLTQGVEERLRAASRGRATAVPLPVVSEYVVASFLSLLRSWLEGDRASSPEEMDDVFRRLVLPGVEAALESE